MDYKQAVETLKYMLGRFTMLFSDMYAKRPHRAQMECGRCDDGFGNIVQKSIYGVTASRHFVFDPYIDADCGF